MVGLKLVDGKISRIVIELVVNSVEGVIVINLDKNKTSLEKLSNAFTIIGIMDSGGHDLMNLKE